MSVLDMIYVDWIVKKEKSIGTWDVFLMLWTLWGLGRDTKGRVHTPLGISNMEAKLAKASTNWF